MTTPPTPLRLVFVATLAACGSSSSGTGGLPDAPASGAEECHRLSFSGTVQLCAESTSTQPGFTCPAQLAVGPCPTTDLIGCCIITTIGQYTMTSGACYYDAASAQSGMASCTGADRTWRTTP